MTTLLAFWPVLLAALVVWFGGSHGSASVVRWKVEARDWERRAKQLEAENFVLKACPPRNGAYR